MKATFWRDTRLLGYVYAALFGWAVVRAVYQDHTYFVDYTKQQKAEAVQAQSTAVAQQKLLDAEIVNLKVACASSAAVATTLQSQNRDQQNSINNCQNQAMKLLTPVDFDPIVISLGDELISGNTTPKSSTMKYLILTNKDVTPVTTSAWCDRYLLSVVPQILGSSVSPQSAPVVQITQSASIVYINVPSPAWTPKSPMMLTFIYSGNPGIHCIFNNIKQKEPK